MFEKVNPAHPDKIADRIAGALVDYVYKKEKAPRIAVEVLIGHGVCHIIAEALYCTWPADSVLTHICEIAMHCCFCYAGAVSDFVHCRGDTFLIDELADELVKGGNCFLAFVLHVKHLLDLLNGIFVPLTFLL